MSQLADCKTREDAQLALTQQVDPIRLVESLRNNGISIDFVVGQLKKIAEDGGSTTQVNVLKMFMGMFINAGMDYDLRAKTKRLIDSPMAAQNAVDAFVAQETVAITDVLKHGSFVVYDPGGENPEGDDGDGAQIGQSGLGEADGAERKEGDRSGNGQASSETEGEGETGDSAQRALPERDVSPLLAGAATHPCGD